MYNKKVIIIAILASFLFIILISIGIVIIIKFVIKKKIDLLESLENSE